MATHRHGAEGRDSGAALFPRYEHAHRLLEDRGPYGVGWRDPIGHAEAATLLGEPTHWIRLPEPPAGAEK